MAESGRSYAALAGQKYMSRVEPYERQQWCSHIQAINVIAPSRIARPY